MPDWTCPRCGERVINFSWDDGKPWDNHTCREIRKVTVMDTPIYPIENNDKPKRNDVVAMSQKSLFEEKWSGWLGGGKGKEG